VTAKKLRLVEITAGAPTLTGKRTGVWATRERMRHAERELAHQAEASPTREWSATGRPPDRPRAPQRARAGGRERDTGARITRPSKGKVGTAMP
jgi:hypothetical protein